MKRKYLASAAAFAAVAVILGGTIPASAEDAPDDSTIVEQLTEAAPELRGDIVTTDPASTEVDGATATTGSDEITIESPAGEFTVTALATGEHSEIETVLLENAEALFAIRLDNAEAPRSYDFSVDLPEGATVTELEDGGYFYHSADGTYLGGTAAPWAKDANGVDIPTSFSFSEGVLTQHVNVDAVENVAYPVIADPLNGYWLVQSAWVTYQSNPLYFVVNAVPTDYGRSNRGAIYLAQHTADLKAKLGTLANKVTPSIENQFHCHVVYNWVGGGATYNMESWRPNIWYWVQSAQECNPT